jgi:hypothetical protein
MDAPRYLHLVPGQPLPELERQPSRVLVICDELVDDSRWQALVSAWLIRSGCLYMLAWGPGCSSWDDSVDCANADVFDAGPIPSKSNAMTTWHEDESLQECMWFAKTCAFHPEVDLERTILLHIGRQPRETELVAGFARA